jgi:beta-ribofuranosylaminobenzene 5'-phosphate synthase
MSQAVLVRAYPRVHMTLVDLAGVTHRHYGGAGFSLDYLPIEVESTVDSDNRLIVKNEVDTAYSDEIKAFTQRVSEKLQVRFSVSVNHIPPQHVGFGSKTAVLLAIGMACNSLAGSPFDRDLLRQLSGRGGASGVGVNIFFQGGFLVDLGHRPTKRLEFLPSAARNIDTTPPVGVRLAFPAPWQVHLLLPKGRRYSKSDEVAFFQRNTPIPGDEVLQVLAALYHGLVPAFATSDFLLLKEAMAKVHAVGFKRREVEGQTPEVSEILKLLNGQANIAAGMSSMGPLVYAIAPVDAEAQSIKICELAQAALGAQYIGYCQGRNCGYSIVRGE